MRPSWRMSTIQDPRKTWLATGSLLTFWRRMPVSVTEIAAAPCLPALAVAHLPLCLLRREQPIWYSLNPLLCEQASLHVRAFRGKFSLSVFFFSSLAIPQFRLLSHICSLGLSSGHSVQVLTLSTDYAAHASLSSPCLLVANTSIWATSPLAVAVRRVFCFCFFFLLLLIMLPSEIPKFPTDPPVRGFPTVWKLLLLHDSLQRMGLCP